MYVAKLLRDHRLQNGMTQSQLAEKLKTTQMFISQVELGKSKPPVSRLKAFCKALGIPMDQVVEAMLDDYRERLSAKMKAA